MDLKERIQSLCKANNVSMNQLEQDLEFGKGYISKLGKSTPNTAKMQKIADYFKVSLDYLMTGKEESMEKGVILTDQEKRLLPYMKKWAARNIDPERIDKMLALFDEKYPDK